jgi:hypothetical protein
VVALAARIFHIWHDRAVFHFLTEPEQLKAYVRQLASALKSGGQIIIATFGPQGPQKCSGLDTRRYDAETLQNEFGSILQHQTPVGTTQQFLYYQFSFSPTRVSDSLPSPQSRALREHAL